MGSVLVLILLAVVCGAGWKVSLWLYPYAPCRRCGGSKLVPGSNQSRWGTCRSCGGSGKRLRLGARERE